MKKYLALILTLCLLLTTAACGASAAQSMEGAATEAIAMDTAAVAEDYDYGWNDMVEAEMAEMAEAPAPMAEAGSMDLDAANYGSSLKIIKTGTLSIETETFDETDTFIRQTVESYGGILAERSVSGTAGSRWASYTARVPSGSFDEFFYDVAGGCTVVSQSISSEDVTEQYTDLSTRLETAKKKYERLLELMDQAVTLTDLYQLESEIASVEYEIDYLTGTLNGLDSRVSYSTIYIDVSELSRVSAVPDQPSFSAALSAAFQNGMNSAIEGIQDFILFLAYNWLGLLVFLVILAVILLVVVRRVRRKQKQTAPTQTVPPEEPKET